MKVACIGEGMLELRVGAAGGGCTLSFGGDTLNTAIYLARLGLRTDFVTVLGDDVHSAAMLEAWRREGVGTDLVVRQPDRLPGLYIIRTDLHGERSFDYWRERAPARELFELPQAAQIAATLTEYDALYVSGITLAIYSDRGRVALLDLLARARAHGAWIVFDGNYRPRLWPNRRAARAAYAETAPKARIVLTAFDDERMLHDDPDPQATARRLRALGVDEVVVKLGASGCLVVTEDGEVPVPAEIAARPVDTTAAGDSFGAAYLAARLRGATPVDAARHGSRLAAAVIRHPGAIIPRDAMPSFEEL